MNAAVFALNCAVDVEFRIAITFKNHIFVPSIDPFLSDIRELRNKFFKYPI